MKKNQLFVSMLVVIGCLTGGSSFASHKPHPKPTPVPSQPSGNVPECLDSKGNNLPVDNAQAVAYKTSTANGSTSRAHVAGPITKIYPDKNGHNHFEISLGNASGDTLEVVYNISFGALPALAVGMNAEACGDFINSNGPENGYPASPDGALIHWIHKTNSGHPGGFTIIDGNLYGQGNGSGS